MADKIRRVTMRVDPLHRLGELVEAARLAWIDPRTRKPYDLKPFIEREAHISRQTWTNIEEGTIRSRPSTYRRVETIFGWEEGSIERYLDDNGPEPGPAREVSEVGRSAERHTISVDYEGSELSDKDRQRIEELVRRLARNSD